VWTEVLADLETPVAAFAKMVGDGSGFLLESVEHGERWSRYSFVGREPVATLELRDGLITTFGTVPSSVPLDRGMLAALDELLRIHMLERISLRGLSQSAVAEMIHALSGKEPPDEVAKPGLLPRHDLGDLLIVFDCHPLDAPNVLACIGVPNCAIASRNAGGSSAWSRMHSTRLPCSTSSKAARVAASGRRLRSRPLTAAAMWLPSFSVWKFMALLPAGTITCAPIRSKPRGTR
jgi:hypothetical protein